MVVVLSLFAAAYSKMLYKNTLLPRICSLSDELMTENTIVNVHGLFETLCLVYVNNSFAVSYSGCLVSSLSSIGSSIGSILGSSVSSLGSSLGFSVSSLGSSVASQS